MKTQPKIAASAAAIAPIINCAAVTRGFSCGAGGDEEEGAGSAAGWLIETGPVASLTSPFPPLMRAARIARS